MTTEHRLPTPPLTVREVADYLGVSERVVRYLLRNKSIAGIKVAGHWRILRESLPHYVIRSMSG